MPGQLVEHSHHSDLLEKLLPAVVPATNSTGGPHDELVGASGPRRRGRPLRHLRGGLVRCGYVMVAVAVLCSYYYRYDVVPERVRLALTDPELHYVYDAADPANNRTAVIDMAGLGNVDATVTAQALPALAQIGQVWAVHYDNAVISTLITTQARRAAVTQIVLVGHSMGGIIALEVAEHIYQDTELDLRAVVLDCTPLNLHAVRTRSRDAGEEMLRWMGWLPGARESRLLRLLTETLVRNDRYLTTESAVPRMDIGELSTVITDVLRTKILSHDTASNGLIESQFKAIVASGATDNLHALTTTSKDKPLPTFVYLRPAIGTHDPVVNVDYSQRLLFTHTAHTGSGLLVVRMPHTAHANPKQQPHTYNDALTHQVLPYLNRQDQRRNDSPAQHASELGAP